MSLGLENSMRLHHRLYYDLRYLIYGEMLPPVPYF